MSLPLQELCNAIDQADRVEITGLQPDASGRAIDLHLVIEGSSLECRILDIRVSKDDWKVLQERLEESAARRATVATAPPSDPTVEYLAEHGLPHYWNRAWLHERLEECGTYAGVARTYPESVCHATGTTIANYARGVYGWRKRARISARRTEVIRTLERDGHAAWTQSKLAKRVGVSVSTINRWLKEAAHAHRLLVQHTRSLQSDAAVEAFAEEHALSPRVVRDWLERGSRAFQPDAVQPQRKAHYYSSGVYEAKKETVRERYLKAGRRLNKSALARELEVDRSTVARWVRELENHSPVG